MPDQASPHWWALALSEEVTAKAPLSVDIGDQPIVLWRDQQGQPHALEDRCPHRRAPLSLGCVRSDGSLQCGYHGWSFDGATGRVVEIPNLKEQRQFPPLYRATAFGVHEAGGFVRVCLDPAAAPPVAPALAPPAGKSARAGTVNLSLDHERLLAALFDDPAILFAIPGVQFTEYLLLDPTEQDGRVVVERCCKWRTNLMPPPFVGDFPLTLRTASDPQTGETDITLHDDALRVLVHAVIAPVPAHRGVTAMRWRAAHGATARGLPGRLLRARAPFVPVAQVDGAALRRLRRSGSFTLDDFRDGNTPAPTTPIREMTDA